MARLLSWVWEVGPLEVVLMLTSSFEPRFLLEVALALLAALALALERGCADGLEPMLVEARWREDLGRTMLNFSCGLQKSRTVGLGRESTWVGAGL